MFKDDACLEKFVTMLVGVSVAGAATSGVAIPPGASEALISGGGLLSRLSGQRRSDAQRIIRETTNTVRAQWTVWIPHSSRTDERDLANAVASFEEVVPRIAPRPADIVGKRLNASAIADLMLERAAAARPEVYADKSAHNATGKLARDFLHELVRRAYGLLTANPRYIDEIAPDLWRGVLEQLGEIKEDTGAIRDELETVKAMLAALPDRTAAARASGITDAALIELARRVSEDVEDAEPAFRELQGAVEIAIRVQQEGATGTNLGDFVDEVLRRVARLSATGDYDGAASEIDAALAAEEAEHRERILRLLDAGIEQDLLRRRPEAVADRLLRKAELEKDAEKPLFDALRPVFIEWYERGRDKGLNLDLEVAIALAERMRDIAEGQDQKGTALNDLGNALLTLGERESGTARLEEAFSAYRLALEEWARERLPLNWATVQMNLGASLQALGQRESGTVRLEEAFSAYHLVLEERTRERVPLDWAKVQMNLGNALRALGQRESETARMEEAVSAYRLTLEEVTRERVPLDWAMAQMNLGTALQALGQRESGTARLEEAVSAYRLCLEEVTRERVPLDWAKVQMNLGNALQALGQRESGTARLEEAVSAYRLCLEEGTRERVPLDWALVQMNLGSTLLVLGGRVGDLDHLKEAKVSLLSAHEVFEEAGVDLYSVGGDRQLVMVANTLESLDLGRWKSNSEQSFRWHYGSIENLHGKQKEGSVEMDSILFLGAISSIASIISLFQQNGIFPNVDSVLSKFRERAEDAASPEHQIGRVIFEEELRGQISIIIEFHKTDHIFLERITKKCLEPFHNAIKNHELDEVDLEEMRGKTEACVCSNINIARKDYNGSFPSEEFKYLWRRFNCK